VNPPLRQRADARIALGVARFGGATGVARLSERGSARLRLPRGKGLPLEAVTINTGGGIAAGDRFATDIEVGAGADLVVTTAAAEKIYRSDGDTAMVATTLRLGPAARLDWLPQETILYDRARLARRLDVDMAGDATLLVFEATVFGRTAYDEVVASGLYEDRWRIRRAGTLAYADTIRLAGPIAAQMGRPSVANGARAMATLLYVAPDAAARIDEARALLEGARCEAGAGAWNGLLVVRWLAHDIETLRHEAARVMTGFGGRPLPRVWHL
jgi:urease accessory protein